MIPAIAALTRVLNALTPRLDRLDAIVDAIVSRPLSSDAAYALATANENVAYLHDSWQNLTFTAYPKSSGIVVAGSQITFQKSGTYRIEVNLSLSTTELHFGAIRLHDGGAAVATSNCFLSPANVVSENHMELLADVVAGTTYTLQINHETVNVNQVAAVFGPALQASFVSIKL